MGVPMDRESTIGLISLIAAICIACALKGSLGLGLLGTIALSFGLWVIIIALI
jgi:hypothetical protein